MSENVHAGHRKRLRKRFIEQGADGFEDHELLELLLFGSVPQGDTNALAHSLLKSFGTLSNLISAHPKDLQMIKGVGEAAAVFLSAQNELLRRCILTRDKERSLFTSSEAVGMYCMSLLMHITTERFYMICLDSGGRLIHTCMVAEGTVGKVIVYPRMIAELAFRHKAALVILAHNHPGGQLRPSQEDIDTTSEIVEALRPIGIGVFDHVIVTHNNYFSLVEHHLMNNGDMIKGPGAKANTKDTAKTKKATSRNSKTEELEDGKAVLEKPSKAKTSVTRRISKGKTKTQQQEGEAQNE